MKKADLNELLVQNILRHGNIGIHVIDKERKTIVYNEAMAELEGLEIFQVMDRDILDIFPSLNEYTSTLIKVMNSGEPIINSTQTYFNYRGHSITTISSTLPLISDGHVIGAMEIAQDVTNLRKLSDQLLELQQELKQTKQETKKTPQIRKYNFTSIIGNNRSLSIAKEIAERASETASSVLIFGETGTGKEMFAQSIHNHGVRKGNTFIAQNCAAIPDSLLEGILFGTEKGGFTGAIEREGIFEQANGGTLLLDEINSMSLPLQAKLLRVLQEGYIRRIGGIRDIPVDVRIIATTNEDPKVSL
ncbi:MAG TPA: sigma 54-interacting transcriptional regulator, partial [Gudongella oleilytica]|nr:sigma 54-interacting transcriptional regulator [Gudongella oleilytica]